MGGNDMDETDGPMRRRARSGSRRFALKSLRRKDTVGLILLGDERTGKTALIKRWLDDSFTDTYTPTVEDCFTKQYNYMSQRVNVAVIDMTGSNQFPAMLELYLKKCDTIMYVYDITNEKSIANMQIHYDQVQRLGGEKLYQSVVGTKFDLSPAFPPEQEDKLNAFLKILGSGVKHVRTSAKTGTNVEQAFENALNALVQSHLPSLEDAKRMEKEMDHQHTVHLPKKKGGCGKCVLM